ncbi:THUMP domain-containing protein, putative [Perkinsus marinus ATCC 50983]|uniref:THUMP domain-containing protein, putative n=1 Tax=Perkinsus marinus (strain ATCC 50983 / TXsc) TaxID=423536 RepID=C5KXH4_PERM5|nr:THUMP domain-containing protein, putative [Perkinsus marinus ATCC 50983]EER10698.1 THUMP domain-containing protein, putative [Perkinsus marinus ATCC 50983]|eukprot:XP_002778903.1 THUMP domain-containing protein, putative [Perkinsus marinus ATCC 50983]
MPGKRGGRHYSRHDAKRRRAIEKVPLEGLDADARGVIITCNLPNRVKTATRDIIRLFELHWAAINPDADKKSTSEEGTANVSESIEAELAELKEEKNRLFRFGGDVCRGVVFIRFEAGVTMKPSEFVHSLLKSKDLTAPSNVCRISPLDIVRAPNPDSLKVMGEKFVAEHLGKESQGTETWKMEINSRNMSNMKRQMVLDLVSPFVDDDKHAVSIVGAELTLLVEVNQLLCGMSLCREFEPLNKYHVGKCLGYGSDDEKDDVNGDDKE